jgi:hypothetical protein
MDGLTETNLSSSCSLQTKFSDRISLDFESSTNYRSHSIESRICTYAPDRADNGAETVIPSVRATPWYRLRLCPLMLLFIVRIGCGTATIKMARPLEAEDNEIILEVTQGGAMLRYATHRWPWAMVLNPVGVAQV